MTKTVTEAAILFILLINIFRNEFITNVFVMGVVAIGFIIFVGLSLEPFLKEPRFINSRLLAIFLIIFTLYAHLLTRAVVDRRDGTNLTKISDAGKVTEVASLALLEGKNPYSVSYESVFEDLDFSLVSRAILNNYPYSPFMFLLNSPLIILTKFFTGTIDIRISLVALALISAFIATRIVASKLLFLTIFLLNPVFINKLFFGASDLLPTLLVFSSIAFLYFKKISLATLFLGLSTATKLTTVPFVPVFFLYLYVIFEKEKDRRKKLFRQFFIFTLVNLLIYLPFLIWSSYDLIDDVFLFHLETRLIGGFLGLPQLLLLLGLISRSSQFPFFVLIVPASIIFFYFSYKIFKRSSDLTTFIIISILYFFLFFFFSRILQTDYIAFISQILLLGGFLKVKGKARKVI